MSGNLVDYIDSCEVVCNDWSSILRIPEIGEGAAYAFSRLGIHEHGCVFGFKRRRNYSGNNFRHDIDGTVEGGRGRVIGEEEVAIKDD